MGVEAVSAIMLRETKQEVSNRKRYVYMILGKETTHIGAITAS